MMTLTVASITPWLTLPVAAGMTIWLAWYWHRLGAADVPESRRRIRRASLLAMLAGVPFLVEALSFLDADRQPGRWAAAWLLVLFCLLLVLATAGADLFNTLRLTRRADNGGEGRRER